MTTKNNLYEDLLPFYYYAICFVQVILSCSQCWGIEISLNDKWVDDILINCGIIMYFSCHSISYIIHLLGCKNNILINNNEIGYFHACDNKIIAIIINKNDFSNIFVSSTGLLNILLKYTFYVLTNILTNFNFIEAFNNVFFFLVSSLVLRMKFAMIHPHITSRLI